MQHPSHARALAARAGTIALFGIVGLVLALVVSFVQPLKYSSTVRLRVQQDFGTAVDAYTASRSEERIAENLALQIYTTTFYDDVTSAGFSIEPNYFPTEDYRRRKEWGRTIDATVSRGTGILTLTAYHPDTAQAEQIARAAAFVLTERVSDYASGSNVTVRLIDAPLNSRFPVKPNIPANAFSGLVLGALVGIGFVLLQAERVARRHQLVHEDFV